MVQCPSTYLVEALRKRIEVHARHRQDKTWRWVLSTTQYLCAKRFVAEKGTNLRGPVKSSLSAVTWSLDGLDECVHVTSAKGQTIDMQARHKENKENHYEKRHLLLALVAQAQFFRQSNCSVCNLFTVSVSHGLAAVPVAEGSLEH